MSCNMLNWTYSCQLQHSKFNNVFWFCNILYRENPVLCNICFITGCIFGYTTGYITPKSYITGYICPSGTQSPGWNVIYKIIQQVCNL